MSGQYVQAMKFVVFDGTNQDEFTAPWIQAYGPDMPGIVTVEDGVLTVTWPYAGIAAGSDITVHKGDAVGPFGLIVPADQFASSYIPLTSISNP
jgi:hypothetical protein